MSGELQLHRRFRREDEGVLGEGVGTLTTEVSRKLSQIRLPEVHQGVRVEGPVPVAVTRCTTASPSLVVALSPTVVSVISIRIVVSRVRPNTSTESCPENGPNTP